MNTQRFYINGEWVFPHSPQTIPVINPSDLSQVCQLAQANTDDIDRAVQAAKDAFVSFSQTSMAERLAYLVKINALLIERNDEIAECISREMGAPIGLSKEAQAPSGVQHFSKMIEILQTYSFDDTTSNGTLVRTVPIGICALITPWNWPMNQVATKVAPAIAAGCTMILKPSECAPLSAIILAEIMHEAGLPPGVFNLVHGAGADIGQQLTSHSDVDMISFTGSTRAGIAISHCAAPTIKRVSLELGGKSAGIISGNIDIDSVAQQVISSAMTNSGQSCNALTRLLIPKNIYPQVSQAIASRAESLSVGPAIENHDIGPLANQTQYKKVKELILTGSAQGATMLSGNTLDPDLAESGYYVQPTIFGDVTPEMTIANEEIFGPVLCLMPYDSLSDAIHIANDSDYGLSGYVWAESDESAVIIADQMRTGMVHINGAGLDSEAPFGGFKMSGNGREWGKYGLHEFLEYKSIYGGNKAQEG
jgi:aldehyde dehydrogenase (NAD+)